MFLQEAEATVVQFDVKGFSVIAARLGPVELGAALQRFYEHVEACVLSHEGRVIKFMGDSVLATWLSSEVDDHRRKALAAVWEAHKKRTAWVQKGVDDGHPLMDYTVAAATGQVLVGHIGTDRTKFFDVLGEPVSHVMKLAKTAAARGTDHLITADALESKSGRMAALEVEGMELGGRHLRLYRLE